MNDQRKKDNLTDLVDEVTNIDLDNQENETVQLAYDQEVRELAKLVLKSMRNKKNK